MSDDDMDVETLKTCLKLHGYRSSDESSEENDDDCKFNKFYEAYKPAPIQIDPLTDTIIEIGRQLPKSQKKKKRKKKRSRKKNNPISSDVKLSPVLSDDASLYFSQVKLDRKEEITDNEHLVYFPKESLVEDIDKKNDPTGKENVKSEACDNEGKFKEFCEVCKPAHIQIDPLIDTIIEIDGQLLSKRQKRRRRENKRRREKKLMNNQISSDVPLSPVLSDDASLYFSQEKMDRKEEITDNGHLLCFLQENLVEDVEKENYPIGEENLLGDQNGPSVETVKTLEEVEKIEHQEHLLYFLQENLVEDVCNSTDKSTNQDVAKGLHIQDTIDSTEDLSVTIKEMGHNFEENKTIEDSSWQEDFIVDERFERGEILTRTEDFSVAQICSLEGEEMAKNDFAFFMQENITKALNSESKIDKNDGIDLDLCDNISICDNTDLALQGTNENTNSSTKEVFGNLEDISVWDNSIDKQVEENQKKPVSSERFEESQHLKPLQDDNNLGAIKKKRRGRRGRRSKGKKQIENSQLTHHNEDIAQRESSTDRQKMKENDFYNSIKKNTNSSVKEVFGNLEDVSVCDNSIDKQVKENQKKPLYSEGFKESQDLKPLQEDNNLGVIKKKRRGTRGRRSKGKKQIENNQLTHHNEDLAQRESSTDRQKMKEKDFYSIIEKNQNFGCKVEEDKSQKSVERIYDHVSFVRGIDNIDTLGTHANVYLLPQMFTQLECFLKTNLTNSFAITSKILTFQHEIQLLTIPMFNTYVYICTVILKLAISYENFITYKKEFRMDVDEYLFHLDTIVLETVEDKKYKSDFWSVNHGLFKYIYALFNNTLLNFVQEIVKSLSEEKEESYIFFCNDVVDLAYIYRSHVVPYLEKVAVAIRRKRKGPKYSLDRFKNASYMFLTTHKPESVRNNEEVHDLVHTTEDTEHEEVENTLKVNEDGRKPHEIETQKDEKLLAENLRCDLKFENSEEILDEQIPDCQKEETEVKVESLVTENFTLNKNCLGIDCEGPKNVQMDNLTFNEKKNIFNGDNISTEDDILGLDSNITGLSSVEIPLLWLHNNSKSAFKIIFVCLLLSIFKKEILSLIIEFLIIVSYVDVVFFILLLMYLCTLFVIKF